jgi:hypothetical protein
MVADITGQFSALTSTCSLQSSEPRNHERTEADENGRHTIDCSALTLQINHSRDRSQLPPASEMKTPGLIGGTSWFSTVDYYRYINEAVNDAYGNSTNPPLILYSMNQEKIHELQAKGQWDEITTLIRETAVRLRAGGAQEILFCANTPHKVYAQVTRNIDLPILHIGDATGLAMRNSGLKKVGLIGTLHTMEDGFMADWLKEHTE